MPPICRPVDLVWGKVIQSYNVVEIKGKNAGGIKHIANQYYYATERKYRLHMYLLLV